MLSAALLFVRALQIVPPQFEGIPKSEGGASDRKGPAMALNSQSLNIRLLYKIATFFYGAALSFLLCLEGLRIFLFCDNPEYQEKQHEKIKGRQKQSANRNAQKKRAGNACIVCGSDKDESRFY